MKGKPVFVYFIFLAVVTLILTGCVPGCDIQNEVKPITKQQEQKETQEIKESGYDIALISPLNNSENISEEGTELVWKAYIKGTTIEATDLIFQVALSTTRPPIKVVKDSNGNSIFTTNKVHSGELESDSTYYWQVIAKDTEGNIFESEIWSFKTTAKTIPQQIEIIKNVGKLVLISPADNSKQTSKNIDFSWKLQDSDYTDVTYTLLIDKSKDFSNPYSLETKFSNYIFKEKLEKSSTYFWKVIAKFEDGKTLESEPFSFTTISPSSPVFLEATPLNEASSVQLNDIKFSWKFVEEDGDSLTYDYYLYEGTVTETPYFLKTSLTSSSFVLTETLKYNQTYFWKVIAKDEDENVVESPIYEFTTMSEEEFILLEQQKQITQIPEVIEISPKDGERISPEKKISWVYSQPLTENLTVELFITKDKNSTPLTITISKDATEYKLDPKLLEKNQIYYWKLKISGEKGIEREYGWYTFLTQRSTAPSTPNLLSPEDGTKINPGKITLKWSQSVDEDEDTLTYSVLLGDNPDKLSEIASNLGKNEFEIPNLERGKTYYWKVIVQDEDKNRIESKISKFTIKLLSDISVLNPNDKAVDIPVKNIRFEWEDEKIEGVKYIFRIGESKDKMSALPFELTENYYLHQTKLKYDTTYYWRVDRRYQGKLIEGETYQFRTVKLPKPEKLNPVGINKSTKNLVLSWEYPLLEVEKIMFDIYLGTDPANLKKLAENITTISYIIPFRLDKEKTYYWKVVAKNDYGISSESEIVVFETIPQTIPFKPVLIEPIDNATNLDFENLTLYWNCMDPDDDELKFLIYLDTINPPQKLLTETKDKKYVVPKLLPDTKYYWQVVAIDEESKDIVSNISSFFTKKVIFYEDFEKENYTLPNVSTKGLVRIVSEPKKGRVLELKADHNSSSEFSFKVNVTITSIMKFEYLVSSEIDGDFFIVYINDKEVYRDSGEKNWNVFETKLDQGQYTVKLVYTKDTISSRGRDCVLIDNIVIK